MPSGWRLEPRSVLGAAALFFCAWLGAVGAPPGLRALRISEKVRVDGGMSEPVWTEAPAASGFTETWPEFGRASHLPTEVRILYDDQYLYVGARMRHDRRSHVVRRVHRRDQDSPSDWFGVYLDSQHDHRTALGFFVNAAGVQRDAVYADDSGSGDFSWDAVWESAVKVDRDGWTAVLKIPFSVLRIPAASGKGAWGVNFSRSDAGEIRETSFWETPPRGESAFASRFPELRGIDGITPSLRREWVPYLAVQRKVETSQVLNDIGWKGDAGLDAHLGITPASQLDLTLHPDFASVEVDQAVLNLSTIETYLPEKRPFFLEGMEIFRTPGTQYFYSRRIGKGLGSPPLVLSGETLLQAPYSADIDLAAKYTAKGESGLDIGVLGARVDNARGTVLEPDGSTVRKEIYPYASYGVVRATQALDDHGSALGCFFSDVREASPLGRSGRLGEVDSILKSQDRSTLFEGSFARAEAGTLGQEAGGARAYLHLNERWRDGWSVDLVGANTSRGFDPNDLGYLGRADERRGYVSAARHWDDSWGIFRNWDWGVDYAHNEDQAGHPFWRAMSTWGRTDFNGFYSLWGGMSLTLPTEDDRELQTYADPVKLYLRQAENHGFWLGADTPGNRPYYARINASRTWFPGGPSSGAGFFQSFKPTPSVEVQADTSVSREEGELHYLETQGATPVVGLRRLSQFNETLRVAYAVSPDLSVQFFSQWLLANWDYRDLMSYQDEDTLLPGAASNSTAFSDRLWNENLIVRWEVRPGSTFWFVYTHGVSTDAVVNDRASISPGADLALLSRLPSDDVFLVKLSWLFR